MVRLNVQKKLNAPEGLFLLDVDTQIQQGQFIALFGPSGCGKTSILRMIAGLLTPDSGNVEVNGKAWLDTSRRINLPPQKREIGFVFQDYGLFPHLSVLENLIYALGKNQDAAITRDLLEAMELGDLRHRKPSTLSGGQKRRVALARALVRKPAVLMLDEPLSALDHGMRTHLQDYLLSIHHHFHLTTILVSHDIREIFRLADRVLVMDQGKIIRQGCPDEIFFSSSLPNDFQFCGEVVEQVNHSGWTELTILTGVELLKVKWEPTDHPPIEVGDQVRVSAIDLHPMIRKI